MKEWGTGQSRGSGWEEALAVETGARKECMEESTQVPDGMSPSERARSIQVRAPTQRARGSIR